MPLASAGPVAAYPVKTRNPDNALSRKRLSLFFDAAPVHFYDRQSISAKAMTMYTIAKRFTFSASHIIGCLPPEHPCGRLHGHNYEVEIVLQATALDNVGFVRDFREFSALKEFLDTTVDHKHLNDVLGHDKTTAETISKWLYDWCKGRWPEVVAIRVCESPRTWAEYRP